MDHIATYTCADCEAIHKRPAGDFPTGWTVYKGKLLCGDCRFGMSIVEPPVNAERGERCETAIGLLSGSYLDLADPDCRVIQPIDVAAGLRQPRFSGQTRQFYTIAQHSLLVLKLVAPIARQLGGSKGLQLKRCALMHDAAEAFLHDITRPLKIQLPDYRRIEARFETRLAERFGWDWTTYRRETVKRADLQALAIEQRDLDYHAGDRWPVLDGIDRDQLAGVTISRAWHPDEAQDRFLQAFAELFPIEERQAA